MSAVEGGYTHFYSIFSTASSTAYGCNVAAGRWRAASRGGMDGSHPRLLMLDTSPYGLDVSAGDSPSSETHQCSHPVRRQRCAARRPSTAISTAIQHETTFYSAHAASRTVCRGSTALQRSTASTASTALYSYTASTLYSTLHPASGLDLTYYRETGPRDPPASMRGSTRLPLEGGCEA